MVSLMTGLHVHLDKSGPERIHISPWKVLEVPGNSREPSLSTDTEISLQESPFKRLLKENIYEVPTDMFH